MRALCMKKGDMMKIRTLFCFVSLFALLVAAGTALADAGDSSGFYLNLKGGHHWSDPGGGLSDSHAQANATGSYDDEDGWTLGGAVGYDFSDLSLNMRMELEYLNYSEMDYDGDNGTAGDSDSMDADIDIQTLMVNAYYDFDTDTGWTPYLGLGVGVAFIDADLSFDTASWRNNVTNVDDGDADTTNFACMGTLGLAYEFNSNWAVDLGLRYSYFGDTDAYEDDDVKFKAKDLGAFESLMGIRYTF